MYSLQVGDRIYGPARKDGQIPAAGVVAILFDDHERFFALVPRTILVDRRQPLFLDETGSTPFTDTGTTDIRAFPDRGAFAVVEISTSISLFGAPRDYTDIRPAIMETVWIGGVEHRVSGFLGEASVTQGYTETDAFVVPLGAKYTPIVGDLCFSVNGVAAVIFGVSLRSRLAVAVPFHRIYERFRTRFRIANTIDLETHNLLQSRSVSLPSFVRFLEWLEEATERLDLNYVSRGERVLEQILNLPSVLALDTPTRLSPTMDEGSATLRELLAVSEILDVVCLDLKSFTFFRNNDTTRDHPSVATLIRSSYEQASKEAVAA